MDLKVISIFVAFKIPYCLRFLSSCNFYLDSEDRYIFDFLLTMF